MNRIASTIFCVAFALGLAATAVRAQGAIDMSKFTCEQLLNGSSNSSEAVIWLSGYYNGLLKNTKLDLSRFQNNVQAVMAECKDSPKATVMQAIKTMTSRKR